MNRVIAIMLMFVMINCAPTIKSDPKAISCKKVKLVLAPSEIEIDSSGSTNTNTYAKAQKRIYVKLSSISPGYLSAFLYENNSNILFEESMECILCHHVIPNINRFEIGRVKESLTFKQIKEILASSRYPLTDSFRHFVGLSFNAGNRLELESSIAFEPNKYYYSMAFFMAVGRNNNFSDTTLFTFYKATYRGDPVIIIEVNGRYRNFYDFAQYPPLR